METPLYIILPYKIGYGKSGNAKTGLKHALICDTMYYQNAFETYQNAILANKLPQDDAKKLMKTANKYFLFENLVNSPVKINEFILPNNTILIFFNIELITQRVKSFSSDKYTIQC
jgi:hypothetical protein